MPTITIRLSGSEKTNLETTARAQGQSVSDYVRRTLELRQSDDPAIAGLNVRVEELRRKVTRLEEMAGL